MRAHFAALAALSLTGCMCRPGVIDCTTGRAYPGFCKPLCGGPCDPFVWACGDCSTCCCCALECGYTPYGGRTVCGDDMTYQQSCEAPPLRWSPPATPAPPTGHVVHVPPHLRRPTGAATKLPPAPAPAKNSATPPTAPPAEPSPLPPEDTPAKLSDDPPVGSEAAPDDTPESDGPPAALRFPAERSESPILQDARNDRWELPRR